MMSLKNINIIKGQLACNAQLMLFLATRKGVTYKVLEEGNRGAKIEFKRGANEYTAEFNENDARVAGLLEKDNWKNYPKDMFFWRAVAKGVRRVCPDAVMGLYTADEISSGEYIDVKEVPSDPLKEEAVGKQEEPPTKLPLPYDPEKKEKPQEDLLTAQITIGDVEEQTEKKDGTKLTNPLYHIIAGDGRDFRTFDKSVATEASKESGTNLLMTVTYKKTKYGLDLKSINKGDVENDFSQKM
jgi:hypothetical protein